VKTYRVTLVRVEDEKWEGIVTDHMGHPMGKFEGEGDPPHELVGTIIGMFLPAEGAIFQIKSLDSRR